MLLSQTKNRTLFIIRISEKKKKLWTVLFYVLICKFTTKTWHIHSLLITFCLHANCLLHSLFICFVFLVFFVIDRKVYSHMRKYLSIKCWKFIVKLSKWTQIYMGTTTIHCTTLLSVARFFPLFFSIPFTIGNKRIVSQLEKKRTFY